MDDAIKNQVNTINQKLKELDSLYHMAALKSEIPDGEISIWSVLLCSDEEYSQQDFADQLFLSKQTGELHRNEHGKEGVSCGWSIRPERKIAKLSD